MSRPARTPAGADPHGRYQHSGAARWWVALSVGVIALVIGTAMLMTARHLPPTFAAAEPHPSPGPATAATPSVTASSSARAAAPTPAVEPFVPRSISLAAFGVTAPVQTVFTGDGVLPPPDDPARVGWWGAGAPAAAATGTTVIVGHVDGPAGPGAFYRLVHARAGDHITVAGDNESSTAYTVTSLQYYRKGSPLPASLFDTAGTPRLVLISCGGSFDRSSDEYTDNVVVQAAPV